MVNLLTVLEDAIEEIALEGLDGSTLPTLWVSFRHFGVNQCYAQYCCVRFDLRGEISYIESLRIV